MELYLIILQDKQITVAKPDDIVELLRTWLKTIDDADSKKEHFIVIHLNVRNGIECVEVVSIGILDASLIHPRETFKRAVLQSSARIVIAHNHPSNVCEPSREDIDVTYKIRSAGEVLGITLVDHIIFSTTEYYSFSEGGLL